MFQMRVKRKEKKRSGEARDKQLAAQRKYRLKVKESDKPKRTYKPRTGTAKMRQLAQQKAYREKIKVKDSNSEVKSETNEDTPENTDNEEYTDTVGITDTDSDDTDSEDIDNQEELVTKEINFSKYVTGVARKVVTKETMYRLK